MSELASSPTSTAGIDVVQTSAAWAPLAAVLLLATASAAASLDGGLAARAEGRSLRSGMSAPWAETARLFRQRRRTTLAADVLLWRVGGASLLVLALLKVAVVPFGRWTLGDLSVGVVWFNAMDVAVWAAVWLAGWGPNSASSLVGGYRFLALALAYELPLMFALTAPAVGAGSLRVGDVVAAQHDLWFVVWMPVAFGVFCAGVVGFSVWGPLSSPLGPDLGGGVLAELSGIDRWLVLAGRWALLTAGSAFGVTLFWGGGAGPALPPELWLLLKTGLLLAALVLVQRRLPTLRPPRVVRAAWLVVLPLVLLQLLVVSVVVVGRG
ncbi:NADH-quinone oxidoreductase subunit H [Modestobacter sp. DSM 44400]|uniref:NADH-quinone oxidoreductase subunit H n=1 Tax=Modestobacter sp. DSM 44400 TaxID=1550230 RepID=UPI000895366B|nr:NADH-quinone oxidoreductase subunit H [Modestobacter sp. DSM 44400]SDY71965.1 NADH-quinone oxidoreductase subunit H [Modestobacter sp. DSM 44400]